MLGAAAPKAGENRRNIQQEVCVSRSGHVLRLEVVEFPRDHISPIDSAFLISYLLEGFFLIVTVTEPLVF
jgi:hypothetical protein